MNKEYRLKDISNNIQRIIDALKNMTMVEIK